MVIKRTEVLAVSGVKGVAVLHLLPTGKILDGTLRTTVAMESDFEQLGILQLHWDKVVNLVHSEPNIQSFYHFISSVHHGNSRVFFLLLNG